MIKYLISILLLTGIDLLFAFEKCEDQSIDSVVNISFDYNVQKKGALKGVSKDRKNFSKINKSLHGENVEELNINDTIFDKDQYKNPKKTFITYLKNLKKDLKDSDFALNYSGHGVRCQEYGKEVTWCMELPYPNKPPTNMNWSESTGTPIIQITDINRMYFVTIGEVYKVLPAKLSIVDSCFSGQMVLEIQKMNEANNSDIFVVSSSTSYTLSNDSKSRGGKLMSSLTDLANLNSTQLCSMDYDKDGVITQREAFTTLFSFHARNAISFISEAIKADFQLVDLDGFHSRLQLPFANPSSQCFINLKGKCRSVNPSHKLNLCETEVHKSKLIMSGLVRNFTSLEKSGKEFLDTKDQDKFEYVGTNGKAKKTKKEIIDKDYKDDNTFETVYNRTNNGKIDKNAAIQLKYLKKIYKDWFDEMHMNIEKKCDASNQSCNKQLKNNFKNVLDFIATSVKPLYSSEK